MILQQLEKPVKLEMEKPKRKARAKKAEPALAAPAPQAGPAAAVAAPRARKAAGPALAIDYPKTGERLAPHHYAVRVTTDGQPPVELSIDEGPWTACRFAAGHYWHDWTRIPAGEHTLVARIKLPNGKTKKSSRVRCRVG